MHIHAVDSLEKKLFVQIIGQLLISDGILADPERDYLERLMNGLGLSDAERREALSGISIDSPVHDRIAALSSDARGRLVEEARRAASADAERSPRERQLLEQIEQLAGQLAGQAPTG